MPNRRRKEKGSFGGSFDELVKVFPDKPRKNGGNGSDKREKGDQDDRHINDKLFEAAWRKAREEHQRSRSAPCGHRGPRKRCRSRRSWRGPIVPSATINKHGASAGQEETRCR